MSTLMTHDDVWHRIPWYVNGRAREAERQQIEAHVRQCEECRTEVAIQRQVMNAIAGDTRIDSMPGASFQRLWDRIRTEEAPSQRALSGRRVGSRSVTRWLAVAVVVEAIGITALTAAFFNAREIGTPAAAYRTVTSSAAIPSRGVIRAVFAPTLSVSGLQQLLEKSGLQVVAGPTEAGVYTLAAATHTSSDSALATLRADPAVRFAEPLSK